MINRSSFKRRTWKSLGLATSLSMVLTAVAVNCIRAQQQLEAAVVPASAKIVVIMNTSIESGSQEQQEFEAFLRDDVPDIDGTCLRKGSKLIGTVFRDNGAQRTLYIDLTFKKIVLPDGKEMKFVAIPRVRGGEMRVTRGGMRILALMQF